MIPYTNNKMYMPGKVTNTYDIKNIEDIEKKKKTKFICMDIINKKETLFIASIKGHIPKNRIHECVHLAPIFRNLEIDTNEETLGTFMYNYMKEHGLTVDKKETKLTTLFSTHDKFMSFSSYYLWFLMDQFGFIIDDMDYFITFDKHLGFNKFVTTFMNDRIENGIKAKNKGVDTMRKIALNGSYGYDIMNEENFSKVELKTTSQTINSHLSSLFKSERKIKDDLYQVNMMKKTFNVNTPIQEGFFTLDNAKYWYLNFLYNFVFKCIDMDKFHLVEGDTDSIYFAVSGDKNKDAKQRFDAIIKDKEFYEKYYRYYLPDEDNKTLEDEKKILGCTIEKGGYSMYALAPKCYTIITDKEDLQGIKKIKGVSLNQNKQITHNEYKKLLDENLIFKGTNTILALKNSQMSKIKMQKNALSAAMTKMYVNPNGSCYPFIYKNKD